ncbi:MAG: hypothetical protein U0441_14290 [Polyangiaceae bacterium]
MRNGSLSRLPTSNATLRARLVRSVFPLALAAAAIVPVAACSPEADPYCADGDMSEWIGTLKVSAFWIEDGWSTKQIEVHYNSTNLAYIFFPEDGWNPENGKVIYARPIDPQHEKGRMLVVQPNTGVTSMKLRAYVLCQGIRGDYQITLTWTGTPKVGDPVDFKLEVAQ